MNIYIDESGSFVNASSSGKWNVVAALAVPEVSRRKLDRLVHGIRLANPRPDRLEIKLYELAEADYFRFLAEAEQLGIVLFCTATDAGTSTLEQISLHQEGQVGGILKNLHKMKYEGGRQGVEMLAKRTKSMSPQLYAQLICQINLMYDVVSRSIPYFAQRNPATLREFRWRVDQKNSEKPAFEEAFEILSPPFLQTMSIEEPMARVEGFDYSYMTEYEFPEGRPPEYLKEAYGIEVEGGFDIQKLVRGNMRFVDSKECLGVQAADLVASGIRRCLRGEFTNNELAAERLGRLMLQAVHDAPSINLVTFGNADFLASPTARLVNIMSRNSRRMIA